MKSADILLYAIPFFVIAILAEIAWTHRKHRHEYRLNDASTCITAGLISFLIGIFAAGSKIVCYLYIYHYFRLTNMLEYTTSLQILCWVSLFITQDLAYYWFHRAAHRINLLWAGHIVHHSSEEYNLAVALRQSTLQQFFSWPFYLPLALIGYPPEWLIAAMSINLIYQFWIHTREIDRMPAWFEAIFNTPSHHRVHHGTNKQYLDKNYGGIFILWDKWFGTFEAEVETVRYGITVPVNSYNPIWINLHHLWYLLKLSSKAPTARQALLVWLAPPNWTPEWVEVNTDDYVTPDASN